MSKLKSDFLSMATLLMQENAIFDANFPTVHNKKSEWKPKFTDEELSEIRSLSKKEKKIRVNELRAKYLSQGQK